MNVCPAIHTLIYRIAIASERGRKDVFAFIKEEEEKKNGIGVALRRGGQRD